MAVARVVLKSYVFEKILMSIMHVPSANILKTLYILSTFMNFLYHSNI